MQEALVRAWRSCSSFDPDGGPLVSWLLALTRNVAIDMARARSRRPPVTAVEASDGAADSSRIGAEDLVLLRSQLLDALAGLGPTHRSAIVETVLRDRPHDEVAAELGIPAGTLRSRIHYALRHLRCSFETVAACA